MQKTKLYILSFFICLNINSNLSASAFEYIKKQFMKLNWQSTPQSTTIHAPITAKPLLKKSIECNEPALHLAVAKNDYFAVEKLLENSNSDIDQQNSIGETALHIAARHGNVKLIQLLLEFGANPNIQDTMNMWRFTPAHVAIMNNQLNAFEELLKSPLINLAIKDANNENIIDSARSKNDIRFINLCFQH